MLMGHEMIITVIVMAIVGMMVVVAYESLSLSLPISSCGFFLFLGLTEAPA